MNKTSVGVIAVFAAAVVGWLSIQKHNPSSDAPRSTTTASASASAETGGVPVPNDDLGGGGGLPSLTLDGGLEEIDFNADGGLEAPDGGKLPELTDAPKSVNFGVVLIQFRGAQGAKPDARSYDEAKALAQELAPLAKEDFEAAVKRGDPGSTNDAGRMYRNILEAAPEVALFSLEKGGVSDPVDTPRGIWIVKRIK